MHSYHLEHHRRSCCFLSNSLPKKNLTKEDLWLLKDQGKMNDALLSDDELPSQGILVPFMPTLGLPEEVSTEESTGLCLVGLLLVFLLFLLVRCFRILLDPYSRMPASSWSDHQDGLERGQFDYAVV